MNFSMIIAAAVAASSPQPVGSFAGSGPLPAPWRVVIVGKKVPPTSYRQAMIHGVGAIEANADSRMALLALPKTTFEQLDHAARAGLRDASHRGGFNIGTAIIAAAENGAALIASHESAAGQTSYWSRDHAAANFDPAWGIATDAPVVASRLGQLPLVTQVSANALERTIGGGDRIRIIKSDPMRPAKQFGAGFVANVLKPELEAAGLWKPGALVAVAYSDRYLKAPLPVLLFMRTAAALRDALATKHDPISLAIQTEPLKEDRYAGTRQWLNQNWPDENDRADTIAALAAQLKFKFEYDDREAPHSRKLTLDYADGTRAVVLFDQGFGYWRATSEGRHNFRQYPDGQAKALLELYSQVRGSGDSYIAVTRG